VDLNFFPGATVSLTKKKSGEAKEESPRVTLTHTPTHIAEFIMQASRSDRRADFAESSIGREQNLKLSAFIIDAMEAPVERK
jgi:hypothetical protein